MFKMCVKEVDVIYDCFHNFDGLFLWHTINPDVSMTKTQITNLNFFYMKICQEMFYKFKPIFLQYSPSVIQMLLTVHSDVVTLLADICCYSTDKDKG